MDKYTRSDWEKKTLIKDSVHGYINIPKPITKEIIDTETFQRLKNIGQTGMEVLYPSATHNRFMHSLGVYHLSKTAFQNFRENVKSDFPDYYESVDTLSPKEKKSISGADAVWARWEILFQLACLLHDCGHTPFSHTLEFLYDLVKEPASLNKRLTDLLSGAFKHDFSSGKGGQTGKPHERMSALYILKDEIAEETTSSSARSTFKKKDPADKTDNWNGFSDKIKRLVESYMEVYDIQKPENYDQKNGNYNSILGDDLEFMVRMITGCLYNLSCKDNYDYCRFHKSDKEKWSVELQLRNCIILMLNSKLDVDNLDYVVRDSKYSGYASSNIDLDRLLSSFTIISGYETNKLSIEMDDFDYRLNLKEFLIESIDAKISGAFLMSSKENNIHVEGNVFLDDDTREFQKEVRQKSFNTRPAFSARVKYAADETCTEEKSLAIRPKGDDGEAKAYLHVRGHVKGIYSGLILSNETNENWEKLISEKSDEVKKRILPAYKHNCMSVLMSAIEGSNFENMWVYAHHTTTFNNNFLSKYLLENFAGYLLRQDNKKFHDRFNNEFTALLNSSNLKNLNKSSESSVSKDSLAAIAKYSNSSYFTKTSEECGKESEEDTLVNEIAEYASEYNLEDKQIKCIANVFEILHIAVKKVDFSQEGLPEIQAVPLLQIIHDLLEDKKFYDEDIINAIGDFYNSCYKLSNQEMQYISDIVAMFGSSEIQGFHFYKSNDIDLDTAYKQLYLKLQRESEEEIEKSIEFIETYEQLLNRNYMKCMWKTYQEYKLHFNDWTKDEIAGLKNIMKNPYCMWYHQGEETGYRVLSDNVKLETGILLDFWTYLKKEFNLKRLVFVEQIIRTKAFNNNETYMQNGRKVIRLEDIGLFNDTRKEDTFFYIYYDQRPSETVDSNKEIDIYQILENLRQLVNKDLQSNVNNQKKVSIEHKVRESITIRDNILGDIFFSADFAELISAKEFQRLRRIKQLATAGQVFPGAVHTRFSHSIGTYHIMKKILVHFENYFKKLQHDFIMDETEKKAILATALLHDIGHGPFSHAFEGAGLTSRNEHTEWTKTIIQDENTEVHQILESWEKGFSEKVIKYIECRRDIKDSENEEEAISIYKDLNLDFIFASLVSGHIDADRMDYLLRDSVSSGINFGQIDIEKLIEGLQVSVENTGDYKICINEDYISYVEQYFYARFQMYRNVYLHPYKVMTEVLLQKILNIASNYYITGSLPGRYVPPTLKGVFNHEDTSIEDFFGMDDNVVMGAIETWSRLTTPGLEDLSEFCNCFLNRNGYKRLRISDVSLFKNHLIRSFGDNAKKTLFESAVLIECKKDIEIYNGGKNPLYIQKKNGTTVKLEDISKVVTAKVNEVFLFYNPDLIKQENFEKDVVVEDMKEKIDQLIEGHSDQRKSEIEKKYYFDKNLLKEMKISVERILTANGYDCSNAKTINQTDIYYDTKDFKLNSLKNTLRIRKKDQINFITFKKPIESSSSGKEGQLERYEDEHMIGTERFEDAIKLVEPSMGHLLNNENILITDLKPVIKIVNERYKVEITKKIEENKGQEYIPEKYEMVFDNVEYINISTGRADCEGQLEIELKSSYQMRVNMKLLTDKIEKELPELKPTEESKYSRAIMSTKQS